MALTRPVVRRRLITFVTLDEVLNQVAALVKHLVATPRFPRVLTHPIPIVYRGRRRGALAFGRNVDFVVSEIPFDPPKLLMEGLDRRVVGHLAAREMWG